MGHTHMLEQLYPEADVAYETTVTLALRLETKQSLEEDQAKRMILRAAVGVAVGVNYTDVTISEVLDHEEAHQQGLDGLFFAGVLVTCKVTTHDKVLSDAMTEA